MIALASLLAALQVAAPIEWRETEVRIAELLGGSPAEVAARLGAEPQPTAADAVRIVADGRSVDLYPMTRFWRRPAHAGEGCVTGFRGLPGEIPAATPGQALGRRSTGVLVFEGGRLVGVHPAPLRVHRDRSVTRETLRETVYGPQPPSPLAAAPGRLPLSDGLGVLSRLEPAVAEASIASACRDLPERPVRSGDVGTDLAWGLVGLVILPTVPFARAEESRAEREGGALLASVEPGSVLPGGVEGFAGRRRGVRVYRDPADPAFAVIAIKLGNGNDNVSDVGLLGVRDDRVVWKAERAAADPSGVRALMCRDAENRPGRHRPGCSGTGFLVP